MSVIPPLNCNFFGCLYIFLFVSNSTRASDGATLKILLSITWSLWLANIASSLRASYIYYLRIRVGFPACVCFLVGLEDDLERNIAPAMVAVAVGEAAVEDTSVDV